MLNPSLATSSAREHSGTGEEDKLTFAIKLLKKAVKSARQFEIRKLSAQLWSLRDRVSGADAHNNVEGARNLKKNKENGYGSAGKQDSDATTKHLQEEIESYKRLALDTVVRMALQEAGFGDIGSPPDALKVLGGSKGSNPQQDGLLRRLLSDKAVTAAVGLVRGRLQESQCEAGPGRGMKRKRVGDCVEDEDEVPEEGAGGPDDDEHNDDEDDDENEDDEEEDDDDDDDAVSFHSEDYSSGHRSDDSGEEEEEEGGEHDTASPGRAALLRRAAGLDRGPKPGKGSQQQGQKKPGKRLGQRARQALREQYAAGKLPPWMVKKYADYLKSAKRDSNQVAHGNWGRPPVSQQTTGRASRPDRNFQRHTEMPSWKKVSGGPAGAHGHPKGSAQKPSLPSAPSPIATSPRKGHKGPKDHRAGKTGNAETGVMESGPEGGKRAWGGDRTGGGGRGNSAVRGEAVRGGKSAGAHFGKGNAAPGKRMGDAGGRGREAQRSAPGGLHPSWEARRAQAEKQAALVQGQGKKIVFDDD
eukprot:jgi/Botrbrau1/7855/Bobra.9_2s0031.1